MKKLPSFIFLVLLCSYSDSKAATVGWGAFGDQALALANNSLTSEGSLVRLGYFNLSVSQIQSYATNGDRLSLNNSFQEFGSSTVGFGNGGPGYWQKTSNNLDSSFAGKQIYYWTLDASSLTAATQWGIFKSTIPAWTFPSDNPSIGQTIIDLDQVPTNSSGLIVGSYLSGQFSNGTNGIYKMSVIAAVPEPSTATFGVMAFLAGCALRRRPPRRLS